MLSDYRFYTAMICVTCLKLGCTGTNSGTDINTNYSLDLDDTSFTDIFLGIENRLELAGSDTIVVSPWYITVVAGVIFFHDRSATPLRIIDKKTHEVIRSYGKGKGPSEFGSINGISANQYQVLVSDLGNSRYSYFDHNGEMDSMVVNSKVLAGDYLFSANDRTFLSQSTNPDFLIQLNSLYSDNEPIFLKEKIIPEGYQPAAYNRTFNSISNQFLAVTNAGIPVIDIFDNDGQKLFKIQVTSDEIQKIENPPVVPVNVQNAMRVNGVFSFLKIIRDQLYIIQPGGIINIIDINTEDPGSSRIVGRFRFILETDDQGQHHYLTMIRDLDYDGKDLYIAALRSDSIYRIAFASKVEP